MNSIKSTNNKNCSIAFTGDIGFDRYMDKRWEDPALLSGDIIEFLTSADHVVANVEGALIEAKDDGSRGVFFHSMNPAAVCVLEQIKADIWNISNNHIMDAGLEGLVSSKEIALANGCDTIGAGVDENDASKPVYIDAAGGIGMFGVAYMTECIPASKTDPGVFRWDDLELIKSRIDEIKSKCRWCIVVAHGGEEFADLPNPYTRDRYIKYLDMGADVVVAHHPHVTENYESFEDGKMIFYSLGNFIFDTDYQRAHPYTDLGVLIKFNFTETSLSFDSIGIRIDRTSESVIKTDLPAIFTDINDEYYNKLSSFGSYMFMIEECKKMIYLEPERFSNASQDTWDKYYYSVEPDGYDKGAHMDLEIIVPHAHKAKLGEWREVYSNPLLKPVIDYMMVHEEFKGENNLGGFSLKL